MDFDNVDKTFSVNLPTEEVDLDSLLKGISTPTPQPQQFKKCAAPGCTELLLKHSRNYCAAHTNNLTKNYQFSTKKQWRLELQESPDSLKVAVYYRHKLVGVEEFNKPQYITR